MLKNIKSDWANYLKGKVDTTTVSYFLIGEETTRHSSEKKAPQNKTDISQLHVFFKNKKDLEGRQEYGFPKCKACDMVKADKRH